MNVDIPYSVLLIICWISQSIFLHLTPSHPVGTLFSGAAVAGGCPSFRAQHFPIFMNKFFPVIFLPPIIIFFFFIVGFLSHFIIHSHLCAFSCISSHVFLLCVQTTSLYLAFFIRPIHTTLSILPDRPCALHLCVLHVFKVEEAYYCFLDYLCFHT